MRKPFGVVPSGAQATLYTIKNQNITAGLTDFGATLVRLWVPDKNGMLADVVLGYDSACHYAADNSCMGAVVGTNAKGIAGTAFSMGQTKVQLIPNDNGNSLHSLPDGCSNLMWQVTEHLPDRVTFLLESPHADQGLPGNTTIRVTYSIEPPATLVITYHAVSDTDTIFNMTNHSFFNLAGHDKPKLALQQELILPARTFVPNDSCSIPTGEDRYVDGTPMDFRCGKPIALDIDADYEYLTIQGGFDHTYEVFTEPCAILCDPVSGRTMAVNTDCPGVHFYSGNYLSDNRGKDGVIYPRRGGICLEPHFYPDAGHHPHWRQPFAKAGTPYRSQTRFVFK